jgi:hypothetical protein
LRWVASLLLLAACAHKGEPTFADAVEASAKRSPAVAAEAAWDFLASSSVEDPRYPRAQRVLASALEDLDLSWSAAFLYRDITQHRRDLEVVPDAVRGLQRILTDGPYDDDLLVTSFLAAEDLEFLPDDSLAFTRWLSARDLYRRGDLRWADHTAAKIPEDSAWKPHVEFARAGRALVDRRDDEAREVLTTLHAQDLPDDLRAEVRLALARLDYEAGDLDSAYAHYDGVRDLAPERPDVLLEMAWTAYRLDLPREAMGLLVALDAPALAYHAAPERYVLTALVARRMCQFHPMVRVADDLRERYAGTLAALEAGTPAESLSDLRAAASRRGPMAPVRHALRRLDWERDIATRKLHDPELTAWLDQVHDRARDSLQRRAAVLHDAQTRQLAEELVAADESLRLLVHELGVSMTRGRYRPEGAEALASVPPTPLVGQDAFAFDGEYWTDELDELVVTMEDRCLP